MTLLVEQPKAPATTGAGLWWRQIRGIARLELAKSVRGRSALAVWGLAALPVLLLAAKAVIVIIFREEAEFTGLANEEIIYADVFDALILRLCIFFGCVAIFVRLFRGDMLSRTLHHYFMAPVRREVLVAGKYLGGVLTAVLVFGTSTALSRLLIYAPYDPASVLTHLTGASGIGHLLAYVAIAALACLGYGAVFLAVGMVFRNPIIPVLVLLAWESANLFLPPLLKPLSVIWYLQSLIPVPIDRGTIAIVAEPAPLALAVPGVLTLTVAMLAIAAWRVRHMEIDYASD
jgi:ABC-type transport system involved in multi-copper enzyme maturation permease subunit